MQELTGLSQRVGVYHFFYQYMGLIKFYYTIYSI